MLLACQYWLLVEVTASCDLWATLERTFRFSSNFLDLKRHSLLDILDVNIHAILKILNVFGICIELLIEIIIFHGIFVLKELFTVVLESIHGGLICLLWNRLFEVFHYFFDALKVLLECIHFLLEFNSVTFMSLLNLLNLVGKISHTLRFSIFNWILVLWELRLLKELCSLLWRLNLISLVWLIII